MQGILKRNLMTGNSKPLGVTPLKEGGNMIRTASGRFVYQQDIDELYAGNPYFKKDVIDQAKSFEGLQKTVPEDRQLQNSADYEQADPDTFGADRNHVRKKQTLDDLYAGNPYYRPAIS